MSKSVIAALYGRFTFSVLQNFHNAYIMAAPLLSPTNSAQFFISQKKNIFLPAHISKIKYSKIEC